MMNAMNKIFNIFISIFIIQFLTVSDIKNSDNSWYITWVQGIPQDSQIKLAKLLSCQYSCFVKKNNGDEEFVNDVKSLSENLRNAFNAALLEAQEQRFLLFFFSSLIYQNIRQ